VVGIDFLNDAYGGTLATDRNLWVDSIAYAGAVVPAAAPLVSTGVASFTVRAPAAVVAGADIVGPSTGHALLEGTTGDDRIVALGGANTILGNGGSDAITGSSGGNDAIVIGAPFDLLVGMLDRVTLSGTGNSVTCRSTA